MCLPYKHYFSVQFFKNINIFNSDMVCRGYLATPKKEIVRARQSGDKLAEVCSRDGPGQPETRHETPETRTFFRPETRPEEFSADPTRNPTRRNFPKKYFLCTISLS